MEPSRVLVVDDEESIRHIVHGVLSDSGCAVQLAESAEQALDLIQNNAPDAAVIDIVLPGMNGIELLRNIKQTSPDTEVVIMTSQASLKTATEAIKAGAYDYLEKPFEEIETVWQTVERALDKRKLAVGNRTLLEEQTRHNQHLSAAVARQSSLIEAGRAMGKYHSLSELLDYFVGLVSQELDVERASLMLLDPLTETLSIAASRGITNIDPQSVTIKLGEGIAGQVAKLGEPMLIEDAANADLGGRLPREKLADSFISAPIIMSMPIKARKHVLGVINVTDRRSGQPFRNEDLEYMSGLAGQLAVAIERARHVDSLLAAQKQLVVSERMQALGQMAAGVAHDFNNTLCAILNRAEVALDRLAIDTPDLKKIGRGLETIRKASLQGASTVKRIQEYTRIRKDAPEGSSDLNQVVLEAIEMTRPKWKSECEANGKSIDIRVEKGKIPPVEGNAHDLIQVVYNLIFNAVEAMPEGGALSLKTWSQNGSVQLDVTDTGTGMDDECVQHLFEPFFTTKKTGQGLGMSIVYGIVSRHHGAIEVDSEVGQGTTFHLRFVPAEAAPEQAEEGASLAGELLRGRILVVDDDDVLRETFEEVLGCDGHEVVVAADGSQAIELYNGGGFDLVITDLGMPGISGLEVAKTINESKAAPPIILLSGWAFQQEEPKIRDAGIDYVLVKPCTNQRLLLTVQRALQRRAAA